MRYSSVLKTKTGIAKFPKNKVLIPKTDILIYWRTNSFRSSSSILQNDLIEIVHYNIE